MAEKEKSATTAKREPLAERDKPVKIDLDPEVALRALLEVDADAPPVEADRKTARARQSPTAN